LGSQISGAISYVGFGCPGDTYLDDPTGKIALIQRGNCSFDAKVATAQVAGAVGVIVFNNATGGESLVTMGGSNPFPGAGGLDIDIPSLFVQNSTGLAMVQALAQGPLTAQVTAIFDGWGDMRVYNLQDPTNPVQLGSSYFSPNSNRPADDVADFRI